MDPREPQSFESDHLDHDGPVTIRTLTRDDLRRLVKMDQAWSGRDRTEYLRGKLFRALGSDISVSLGAEVDGSLVGALLGSVQYGEYGVAEPIAVLDTVLVDPTQTRHGVAKAMLSQLMRNLAGLRIERVRTDVSWNEQALIGFFAAAGFTPAPRLVLERVITPSD